MNRSSSASIGSRVVVEGAGTTSSSSSLAFSIAHSATISSNESRSIDPSRSHGRIDVVVAVISVDARRRVTSKRIESIASVFRESGLLGVFVRVVWRRD